MKRTFSALLILCLAIISCNVQINSNKPIDPGYRDTLLKTKVYYPFDNWRKAYDNGLLQYTEQNCNQAKEIFDNLVTNLITLGKDASSDEKISLFKAAILQTNDLNDKTDGSLIETGEREQLVELTNKITLACGLDPNKYGDGEGLASEWRDW